MAANLISSPSPISVLICTRNRPDDLVQALPGVLAQTYPDYEVVLVDQSTNDESERRVLAAHGGDRRLRYVRTATVGLSIARNIALSEARYEICAFTDDDCVVHSEWLNSIAMTYGRNPDTHVLFSPVHIPRDLLGKPELRFTCLYFSDSRVLRRFEIFGMGANMSMRKSFWRNVGPFDAMLGPGTSMPGSDEHDWLYRAHRLHANIRLEPTNAIEHRAWRTSEEWMRLTDTYAYGDGAFAMKHLRCGDAAVIPMMAQRLLYIGARGILRTVQHRDARYEFHYVRGYWKGLWGSLQYRVDKRARLFAQAPSEPKVEGRDAAPAHHCDPPSQHPSQPLIEKTGT
jgi:glycosyltransferase involved in cell wall biosynthesis